MHRFRAAALALAIPFAPLAARAADARATPPARSAAPSRVQVSETAMRLLRAWQTGKPNLGDYAAAAARDITPAAIASEKRRLAPFGEVKRSAVLLALDAKDKRQYEIAVICAQGLVVESLSFDGAGKVNGVSFRGLPYTG